MNLIGKRQKTILHVAKARLGLTEEIYRDILRIHGGVESSVDLKWPGYRKVLGHLESLGFKQRHSGESRNPGPQNRTGFATPRQVRMIQGLWAELSYAPEGKQAGALREFLRRYGVSDLRFLSGIGATKVINGLLAMKEARAQKYS